MKYADGREIIFGDKIKIGESEGFVVADFEKRQFSDEYDENEWGEYNIGVLVKTDMYGLILFDEIDDDLYLIDRA